MGLLLLALLSPLFAFFSVWMIFVSMILKACLCLIKVLSSDPSSAFENSFPSKVAMLVSQFFFR